MLEGVPDNVLSGGEGKITAGNSPILRMYKNNSAAQMIGMMVVDAFIGIEHYPGMKRSLIYKFFYNACFNNRNLLLIGAKF